MWAVNALIAASLTSFLPIINKRLLKDVQVPVVAWTFNALSLPLLIAAALLLVGSSTVDSTFYAAVAASSMLNLGATLMSTQSLKLADASLVTPLLTFNPLFTLAVATFTLQERPGVGGLLGVVVIAAGSYLLAVEEVARGFLAPIKALVTNAGVLLALLASALWGLTPVFEKVAIRHTEPSNPPLVAFATTLGMVLLLLPPVAMRSQKPAQQIASHGRGFLLAGVIAGIAPIFGFTAISEGLVGYVSALFKLSAVLSVIWASLILKEPSLRQRLFGTIVIVSGSLLVVL